MDEKEKLYVDLMMDHLPEDCDAQGLKKMGYFNDQMRLTPKAYTFIEDFLASKEEVVLAAIKELGPGARKSAIMKSANIRQMGTLADVVKRLEQAGKIKKENNDFIPLV